jgi:hypothetical protein
MYSLQLSVWMWCPYLMFWTPIHLSSQDDAVSDRNIHCIHNYGTQYYPNDGGSIFLQTMLHIYQTTRYHIPEDMKLQSLTLESKPHLALEILRIFNQNRTMANVQYMPLNPFRSYIGPRPIVWFSCSAPMSEDVRQSFCCVCSPAVGACPTLFLM